MMRLFSGIFLQNLDSSSQQTVKAALGLEYTPKFGLAPIVD